MFDFLKKPVILRDDSKEIVQLKEQVVKLIDENTKSKADNEIATKKTTADHEIEINKLKAQHEIDIKEKIFEINHKNDDDKLKLTGEKTELATNLAVANETIKQLDRIVDLNADVIDVKDLVTRLINKLPEVKIGGTLKAETVGKDEKKS